MLSWWLQNKDAILNKKKTNKKVNPTFQNWHWLCCLSLPESCTHLDFRHRVSQDSQGSWIQSPRSSERPASLTGSPTGGSRPADSEHNTTKATVRWQPWPVSPATVKKTRDIPETSPGRGWMEKLLPSISGSTHTAQCTEGQKRPAPLLAAKSISISACI